MKQCNVDWGPLRVYIRWKGAWRKRALWQPALAAQTPVRRRARAEFYERHPAQVVRLRAQGLNWVRGEREGRIGWRKEGSRGGKFHGRKRT